MRWNARVTGLTQDEDGVTVQFEQDGEPRELRCDWLVGADGGRSAVRQACGLSFDGYTHPERLVSTNVRYDFEARGYARANFIVDPVHWAVIVKVDRHGLWRVTYGEDARAAGRERRGAHSRNITVRFCPTADPYELEAFAPFRVHERCAASFRAGRVLLAGDAAHVCNPFGGLGLTSGLLDGSFWAMPCPRSSRGRPPTTCSTAMRPSGGGCSWRSPARRRPKTSAG